VTYDYTPKAQGPETNLSIVFGVLGGIAGAIFLAVILVATNKRRLLTFMQRK
jgi:uncharacterized protein involved in exopolysaccharide biosynthesis